MFPEDKELIKVHKDLRDDILTFFNSCIEEDDFKSVLFYPKPEPLKLILGEAYPNDIEMEELCIRYADAYKVPYTADEIEEKINNALKDDNKNENFILTLILVDIPAILLLPFIMITVHNEYSSPFLVLSIITGIILIIGLVCKANSCKVCGKFNAYQIVDEEVLDSWVTTEEKNEYNSRTNTSRKVYVTVTKENVRLTKKCTNCGNIRYEVTTRTKY